MFPPAPLRTAARAGRHRRAVAACVVASASVGTGCGGSTTAERAAVLRTVRRYVVAVDTNDAAAACRLVTRQARQAEIVSLDHAVGTGEFVGLRHARTCADAFHDLHPGPRKGRGITADPRTFLRLDRARVVIAGTTASVADPVVPVMMFGLRLELVKVHGVWLLTELD